jgi:hypothetical protein
MNIITIEGLVAVKYLFRGDKAFQYFSIQSKKNIKKYLTDSRFIVYDKFEEKIKSFALSNDPNFIFLERRNEEDKITLEFKIQDVSQVTKPSNFYFMVPGFVPPSAGCFHCKYRKDHDDTFFYCEYKQKTLTNKLKNCQFFRQEEGLFKT